MDETMNNNSDNTEQEMSVDEAFKSIQEILAEMEKEGISLEKTFENYEKGMKLVRYCNDKIDRVEKKVRMMNGDGTVTDFGE